VFLKQTFIYISLLRESMQIVFLGTSCAKPTKQRNHSSVYLSYGSDGILFDCGEGTQRQMSIAGIKHSKINKILISHWHGDHVLGLPGLIQSLGMSEYEKTLRIYIPKGTKKFFDHMLLASVFEIKIDIEVKEVDGKFYNGSAYTLESAKMKHGPKTNGYRFVEKDKRRIKVSYVKKLGIPDGPLLGKLQDGETITWKGKKVKAEDATTLIKGAIVCYLLDGSPSDNSILLARDADIMIADSTFTSALEEKAEEYNHMTAKQAGLIANQANVKKLVLTHFSTRYKDAAELVEEAKEVFQDVVAANDFMKINL